MRINRYMEVVGSGGKPGKDEMYNAWYHKHITDLFPFEPLKRVCRNKLYEALGDFKPPPYLTWYEFEAPEHITEFFAHPLMKEADAGYAKDGGLESVQMNFAGYYEPVETYEKEWKKGTNYYTEVVCSGPLPGKDKEYNEWYHKHITDLYPFEGLKRVSRYKMYNKLEGDIPPYLTIYEFESAEEITAFYEHPLMAPAKVHYETEGLQCLEIEWAGFFAPVETIERE